MFYKIGPALVQRKVVLQVGYCTERQRYKLLKRVISTPGLLSIDWVGDDQLAVTGNNIDIVTLIAKMRNRIGVYADILSFTVEETKEEEATSADTDVDEEGDGEEEDGEDDGEVENESREPFHRHCYCRMYNPCGQNDMCRIM